jgi:hypothetical protein
MTTVVRLKRTKLKIIQDCDVYIGRAVFRGGWELLASKWANTISIAKAGSAERAVELYEEYLHTRPDLLVAIKSELKGKRLGCWCWPNPCHGNVLARLADQ